MKLKELIYLLGIRPSPRTYGYTVVSFDFDIDGKVNYARWDHPRERSRVLSQHEVNELRKFLNPGDVAIDVGAHTGDSTIPIALAVGKEGCVYALEPNPYVFPVLVANSKLNKDKTNIVPLMFAATKSDGEITFEYSDSGFCNGGRHEGISKWRHGHAFKLNVAGRNLENYLRNEQEHALSRLRYIKIDAEGYDFEVLKSIPGILDEIKPYLKVEVFSRMPESARKDMIKYLESFGYTIYVVSDNNNYKDCLLDKQNVMRKKHYDIFCIPN